MAHRVGIIGLGTVGSRFVEQFTAHPDFELATAWDPDDDACAAHADAVTIAAGADDVVASADVVYIAVPPLFHAGYVDACIAARTAIFCEKPLGIDVAESRALVDRVERSGLPAGVNFVFGAAPSALGLRAAVRDGDLGALVGAELRLHFAEWPRAWHTRAQWLRRRDQGGWIREVASHFVFLAARVLGPLAVESATIRFPDGPSGELCERDALVRFDAGGCPLLMLGTSGGVGPDTVELTVRGERGGRRIHDWYRLQSSDGDRWVDLLGDDRAGLGAAAYRGQLDALATLLDGGPSELATFAEALAVQEVVESVLAVG